MRGLEPFADSWYLSEEERAAFAGAARAGQTYVVGPRRRPAHRNLQRRVRRTPVRRGLSTAVNARQHFTPISFPQPFPRPCRRR
jgi:hypothetical protein